MKALCRKGRSGEIPITQPGGKIVFGNLLFNSDYSLLFEQKPTEELLCPRCKIGLIVKGKSAWGCTAFRNGCQLRVPFVFMGRSLSDSNMEQLILKGKTVKINGFVAEGGLKRDGRLLFDKEFRVILE